MSEIDTRIGIVAVFLLAVNALLLAVPPPALPQQGPLIAVTIAEGEQPIGGLLYVAYANNYFSDEGLAVRLEPYSSGKDAVDALARGDVDVVAAAETLFMRAVLERKDVAIVATIGESDRSEAIVGRKDKRVLEPSGFERKTIGVTPGTGSDYFLDIFLAANRFTDREIEVVNLEPHEMFAALIEGTVDAVSTRNPHVITLQQRLDDQAAVFYVPQAYTLMYNLATRRDVLADRPEVIKKLIRALIRAQAFVRAEPDRARDIVGAHLNLSAPILAGIWSPSEFRISLDQSLLIALESEARWAIRKQLVPSQNVPNFLDSIAVEPLESISPAAVTLIR